MPIRIVVFRARQDTNGAPPLFALAGGPGGAGTTDLVWVPNVFDAVHNARDIVLFDQRGTGATGALILPPFPNTAALSDAAARQQIGAWASDYLSGVDVDPATLTSMVAADDMDAVRAALGYDTIDLFGPSYGGTLAQYYVRQHPEHVGRVVLDGATPLDVPIYERMASNSQAALDLLLRRCSADSACHAAFPAIQSEWTALEARLQRPTDTGLIDPQTGKSLVIALADLAPGIHSALVEQAKAATLPMLIHLAFQSQWEAVQQITGAQGAVPETPLMQQEIVCSEAWARFAPAVVAYEGRGTYLVDAEEQAARTRAQTCVPFSNGLVPEDDAAPMRSDVPILWLAGDGDPQDPSANLTDVPEQNPHVRIVVVPAQNHTVGHLGCVPDVVARFLAADDPSSTDSSCVAGMSPLAAFRVK